MLLFLLIITEINQPSRLPVWELLLLISVELELTIMRVSIDNEVPSTESKEQ